MLQLNELKEPKTTQGVGMLKQAPEREPLLNIQHL